MSPLSMVGWYPSSKWRSDPQIAHAVILMTASRGCWILGSGTVSTRTSPFPCQHSARMIVSVDFAHTNGRRDQPFLGTANSKCRAASDADAFGHLWLIPA